MAVLEKQVEDRLVQHFTAMPELSACQVVGSRNIAPEGELNEQGDEGTVVALAVGYRAHQAFSLPMIDVPVTVTVMTRVEDDSTAAYHERVVERISDRISQWHFDGALTGSELSTQKFMAGELKSDGGTGRKVDQTLRAYSDSISFTLRGSEIF